jgi:uncharacterized protein YjbJ (UPF0337 family)
LRILVRTQQQTRPSCASRNYMRLRTEIHQRSAYIPIARHADDRAGVEIEIIHQESGMSINKDQVTGRIDEVKGKVKEVVGKAFGNKELEQKGKIETGVGKVETAYGDLKHDVKKSL